MPLELNHSDAGFEAAFTGLLAAKRETQEDVQNAVAAILADVRARGDAALLEYTARFDRVTLTVELMRVTADEIDRALASIEPGPAGRAQAGGRADRGLPPAADSRRIVLHRRRRRPSGRALDGGRFGRPLCAGRNGGLSEFRPDERAAGQGRRGRARDDGRADARRQAQPAGAGRRPHRRRSRDLPDRRRPGGRRAGLWDGDDPAGRQDRRSRQRLCRGGQAPCLRHGRHRHDRRPVGNPGGGRRRQRSGLDRRRPAVAGGTRHQRPVDPDHRRRRLSPKRSRRRSKVT